MNFLLFDFANIGFMGLLLLFLTQTECKIWQVGLIAGLGQFCYEHLGFLTGVSVAAFTLLAGKGRKMALFQFISAGIAASTVLVVQILILIAVSKYSSGKVYSGTSNSEISYYLSFIWDNYGKYNLMWWKTVLANIITITFLPWIVGMLLGLLPGYKEENLKTTEIHFQAGMAISLAWAVTTLIGMFISGFTSDVGRQLAPFTVVAFFWGMKTGSLGGIFLKHRHKSSIC